MPSLLCLLCLGAFAQEPTPGDPDQSNSRSDDVTLWRQGVRISLDRAGARLAGPSGSLQLTLRSWGRPTTRLRPAPAVVTGAPCFFGPAAHECLPRLQQDHGGISAWWVPRVAGLQQGWTVHAAPGGAGPLMLRLDAGDTAVVSADGQRAVLTDDAGGRWSYRGLMAWDATGRSLRAHLEAAPGGMSIVVDDTAAAYPVTIDPLIIGTEDARLVPSNPLPNAQFGKSLAGLGDVNGDGLPDVAIGAPSDVVSGFTASGVVYVYSGSRAGISNSSEVRLTSAQADDGDLYGISVAAAGDVNGDGFDDLVVGASRDDNDIGSIHVYLGSAAGIVAGSELKITSPSVTTSTLPAFGFAVSGAGDVNNDGYDDIVVGADGEDTNGNNSGAVFVYLGSANGIDPNSEIRLTPFALSGGDRLGLSVSGAGDVNGDGYDDVIAGAFGDDDFGIQAGAAHVWLGGPAGPGAGSIKLTASDAFVRTEFGWEVAGVGDLDADGFDDVAVTSIASDDGADEAGSVYIYYGSGQPGVFNTEVEINPSDPQTQGHFGDRLAGGCDLNGDGYDDLLVASSDYGNRHGAAYAFEGSVTGVDAATENRFYSTDEIEFFSFGSDIACAGDVDLDGDIDVLVGAFGHLSNRGAVYFFGGCTDSDADDICIQQDCDDNDPDVGLATTQRYRDADRDGWGANGVTAIVCPDDPAYADIDGDCDDGDPNTYPGADEVCDQRDQDCDSEIDEDLPTFTWYLDVDADGSGDPDAEVISCSAPPGSVSVAGDCDDLDPNRAPGFTEICDGIDSDCDQLVDEQTECFDDDGDGVTELGGDCDDEDATRRPGTPEICDGVDQDCDDLVDEGTSCYDDDGDGYTEEEGDCHDGDASINPGAVEVDDDGIDNDCNQAFDPSTLDTDNDGFTPAGGDCDDTNADIRPGLPEIANGIDEDCDELIDENTERYDDDGDGFTELQGDCNDADANVNPDAAEVLPGVDDDCNGIVDDGNLWTDSDGDGFAPAEGDCDDTEPTTYPGAEELEDGVDNDCSGKADEPFIDSDRDGVTTAEGDCDDHDGWTRPAAVEFCDSIDNDCNGQVDDNCDGTVVAPPRPPSATGCTCATGGSPSLGWLMLLPLFALRRRRLVGLALLAGACETSTSLSAIEAGITLTPELSDAGAVAVGSEGLIELTITHVTGPAAKVLSVDIQGPGAAWFRLPEDVELPEVRSNETATLPILYAPEDGGYHHASVSVIADAGKSPRITVRVRGRGVEPGVSLWPTRMDFGAVLANGSTTRSVFLRNDTIAPWTLAAIDLGAPFSADITLPLVIDAEDSVEIPLTFRPLDEGASTATATFIGEVETDGLVVDLLGNDCESGDPGAYDLDGDGFISCASDCDDTTDTVRPGAPEIANGVDDDCDGIIDEGTEAYDDDGDGYTELEGDCHDGDAAISPGASETEGNGIDDDCDGQLDAGTSDSDGDGFSPAGGDCDDTDPDRHPGAVETGNAVDDDCDGVVDEGTVLFDDDGDGFTELEGDCDDDPITGPAAAPSLPETADGRDNDCDGAVDEGTNASDDDGDGYSEDGGDCNDLLDQVHPYAREIPGNGQDEDCDPNTPS